MSQEIVKEFKEKLILKPVNCKWIMDTENVVNLNKTLEFICTAMDESE